MVMTYRHTSIAATTSSVSCVLLCAPFPMTLLWSLCNVHAFVTSTIDHSCSVLVGLPLGSIGRLDRVLCSAARLIGHIPKYASVSAYMHDVLHWLPVSQCILYRISALVWRSITGCAPSYLTDLCRPVSDLASRRVLRLVVSFWFLGPALHLNSIELSLLLAPALGMNSLLHCAWCSGTTRLLSASFLRHFSLAVAGLRAHLSRFLEGALYKYLE